MNKVFNFIHFVPTTPCRSLLKILTFPNISYQLVASFSVPNSKITLLAALEGAHSICKAREC